MEVEIEGFEQIRRQIAELGNRKIEERALKAGAEYLKAKLEAEVPVDDGVYKRGIVVTKRGKRYIVHTGKVPHAHLVEFGRSGGSAKYVDKNGVTRTVKFGPTAPNPVVARTYESEQNQIMRVIGEEVRRALNL